MELQVDEANGEEEETEPTGEGEEQANGEEEEAEPTGEGEEQANGEEEEAEPTGEGEEEAVPVKRTGPTRKTSPRRTASTGFRPQTAGDLLSPEMSTKWPRYAQ